MLGDSNPNLDLEEDSAQDNINIPLDSINLPEDAEDTDIPPVALQPVTSGIIPSIQQDLEPSALQQEVYSGEAEAKNLLAPLTLDQEVAKINRLSREAAPLNEIEDTIRKGQIPVPQAVVNTNFLVRDIVQDLNQQRALIQTDLGNDFNLPGIALDGDTFNFGDTPGLNNLGDIRITDPNSNISLDTLDGNELKQYRSIGKEAYAEAYKQGLVAKSPYSISNQDINFKKFVKNNNIENLDIDDQIAYTKSITREALTKFSQGGLIFQEDPLYKAKGKFKRDGGNFFNKKTGEDLISYMTKAGLNFNAAPSERLKRLGFRGENGNITKNGFVQDLGQLSDNFAYTGVYQKAFNNGSLEKGLSRLKTNLKSGVNSIELLLGDLITGGIPTKERTLLIKRIRALEEEYKYKEGRALNLADDGFSASWLIEQLGENADIVVPFGVGAVTKGLGIIGKVATTTAALSPSVVQNLGSTYSDIIVETPENANRVNALISLASGSLQSALDFVTPGRAGKRGLNVGELFKGSPTELVKNSIGRFLKEGATESITELGQDRVDRWTKYAITGAKPPELTQRDWINIVGTSFIVGGVLGVSTDKANWKAAKEGLISSALYAHKKGAQALYKKGVLTKDDYYERAAARAKKEVEDVPVSATVKGIKIEGNAELFFSPKSPDFLFNKDKPNTVDNLDSNQIKTFITTLGHYLEKLDDTQQQSFREKYPVFEEINKSLTDSLQELKKTSDIPLGDLAENIDVAYTNNSNVELSPTELGLLTVFKNSPIDKFRNTVKTSKKKTKAIKELEKSLDNLDITPKAFYKTNTNVIQELIKSPETSTQSKTHLKELKSRIIAAKKEGAGSAYKEFVLGITKDNTVTNTQQGGGLIYHFNQVVLKNSKPSFDHIFSLLEGKVKRKKSLQEAYVKANKNKKPFYVYKEKRQDNAINYIVTDDINEAQTKSSELVVEGSEDTFTKINHNDGSKGYKNILSKINKDIKAANAFYQAALLLQQENKNKTVSLIKENLQRITNQKDPEVTENKTPEVPDDKPTKSTIKNGTIKKRDEVLPKGNKQSLESPLLLQVESFSDIFKLLKITDETEEGKSFFNFIKVNRRAIEGTPFLKINKTKSNAYQAEVYVSFIQHLQKIHAGIKTSDTKNSIGLKIQAFEYKNNLSNTKLVLNPNDLGNVELFTELESISKSSYSTDSDYVSAIMEVVNTHLKDYSDTDKVDVNKFLQNYLTNFIANVADTPSALSLFKDDDNNFNTLALVSSAFGFMKYTAGFVTDSFNTPSMFELRKLFNLDKDSNGEELGLGVKGLYLGDKLGKNLNSFYSDYSQVLTDTMGLKIPKYLNNTAFSTELNPAYNTILSLSEISATIGMHTLENTNVASNLSSQINAIYGDELRLNTQIAIRKEISPSKREALKQTIADQKKFNKNSLIDFLYLDVNKIDKEFPTLLKIDGKDNENIQKILKDLSTPISETVLGVYTEESKDFNSTLTEKLHNKDPYSVSSELAGVLDDISPTVLNRIITGTTKKDLLTKVDEVSSVKKFGLLAAYKQHTDNLQATKEALKIAETNDGVVYFKHKENEGNGRTAAMGRASLTSNKLMRVFFSNGLSKQEVTVVTTKKKAYKKNAKVSLMHYAILQSLGVQIESITYKNIQKAMADLFQDKDMLKLASYIANPKTAKESDYLELIQRIEDAGKYKVTGASLEGLRVLGEYAAILKGTNPNRTIKHNLTIEIDGIVNNVPLSLLGSIKNIEDIDAEFLRANLKAVGVGLDFGQTPASQTEQGQLDLYKQLGVQILEYIKSAESSNPKEFKEIYDFIRILNRIGVFDGFVAVNGQIDFKEADVNNVRKFVKYMFMINEYLGGETTLTSDASNAIINDLIDAIYKQIHIDKTPVKKVMAKLEFIKSNLLPKNSHKAFIALVTNKEEYPNMDKDYKILKIGFNKKFVSVLGNAISYGFDTVSDPEIKKEKQNLASYIQFIGHYQKSYYETMIATGGFNKGINSNNTKEVTSKYLKNIKIGLSDKGISPFKKVQGNKKEIGFKNLSSYTYKPKSSKLHTKSNKNYSLKIVGIGNVSGTVGTVSTSSHLDFNPLITNKYALAIKSTAVVLNHFLDATTQTEAKLLGVKATNVYDAFIPTLDNALETQKKANKALLNTVFSNNMYKNLREAYDLVGQAPKVDLGTKTKFDNKVALNTLISALSTELDKMYAIADSRKDTKQKPIFVDIKLTSTYKLHKQLTNIKDNKSLNKKQKEYIAKQKDYIKKEVLLTLSAVTELDSLKPKGIARLGDVEEKNSEYAIISKLLDTTTDFISNGSPAIRRDLKQQERARAASIRELKKNYTKNTQQFFAVPQDLGKELSPGFPVKETLKYIRDSEGIFRNTRKLGEEGYKRQAKLLQKTTVVEALDTLIKDFDEGNAEENAYLDDVFSVLKDLYKNYPKATLKVYNTNDPVNSGEVEIGKNKIDASINFAKVGSTIPTNGFSKKQVLSHELLHKLVNHLIDTNPRVKDLVTNLYHIVFRKSQALDNPHSIFLDKKNKHSAEEIQTAKDQYDSIFFNTESENIDLNLKEFGVTLFTNYILGNNVQDLNVDFFKLKKKSLPDIFKKLSGKNFVSKFLEVMLRLASLLTPDKVNQALSVTKDITELRGLILELGRDTLINQSLSNIRESWDAKVAKSIDKQIAKLKLIYAKKLIREKSSLHKLATPEILSKLAEATPIQLFLEQFQRTLGTSKTYIALLLKEMTNLSTTIDEKVLITKMNNNHTAAANESSSSAQHLINKYINKKFWTPATDSAITNIIFKTNLFYLFPVSASALNGREAITLPRENIIKSISNILKNREDLLPIEIKEALTPLVAHLSAMFKDIDLSNKNIEDTITQELDNLIAINNNVEGTRKLIQSKNIESIIATLPIILQEKYKLKENSLANFYTNRAYTTIATKSLTRAYTYMSLNKLTSEETKIFIELIDNKAKFLKDSDKGVEFTQNLVALSYSLRTKYRNVYKKAGDSLGYLESFVPTNKIDSNVIKLGTKAEGLLYRDEGFKLVLDKKNNPIEIDKNLFSKSTGESVYLYMTTNDRTVRLNPGLFSTLNPKDSGIYLNNIEFDSISNATNIYNPLAKWVYNSDLAGEFKAHKKTLINNYIKVRNTDYKIENDNYTITPKYSNKGVITDLRIELSDTIKYGVLEESPMNLIDSIGFLANEVSLSETQGKSLTILLDALRKQHNEAKEGLQTNKRLNSNFVNVFTLDPKKDFIDIKALPSSSRKILNYLADTDEQGVQTLYVSKGLLYDIFQHKPFSVFNNKEKSSKIEHLARIVSSIISKAIVLKTPGVILNNILSGITYNLYDYQGFDYLTPINATLETIKELEEYNSRKSELLELKANLSRIQTGSKAGINKLKAKIIFKENIIKQSSFQKFINKGLQNAITSVEGLEFNKSNLDDIALTKLIARYVKKLPIELQTVFNNLFVLDNTNLGQSLFQFVLIADTVNRITNYKLNKLAGYSEAQSVEKAIIAFVHFDSNLHPRLAFANDVGLALFFKFWLRTHVNKWRMIKNHPITAVSYALLEHTVGDIPDISDSALIPRSFIESSNRLVQLPISIVIDDVL